ncbi:MAG: ABC transporter ATP-binding protein [Proteobacteria bacterium]|nr:MAG: ABC transporter ATP-binding protein [Pseudomonadota bacterium]
MTPAGSNPLLELSGITKSFPGCLANDGIDLDIARGEIHALLGENGAGKSTLVKIIYGILDADAGRIAWDGEPVSIDNPGDARRLGIAMVFQHFSLFDALTVVENIALGMDKPGDMADLEARIERVSHDYGLPLHPRRHVYSLSVGERQRIEIVRCLLQDPKLLVMDEPTSVLTPQEVDKLFETLRRLSDEGMSILYISHKLDEIRALCHRATILRLGKRVADADPTKETARSLAAMMMGEELASPAHPPSTTESGPVRLEVNALALPAADEFGVDLEDINLSVRGGEILGIAGVAGNGQNELTEALSGERLSLAAGTIRIDGTECGLKGPDLRRALGLACVPEQRLGHGAVPDMSLAENVYLTAHYSMGQTRRGMVRTDKRDSYADRVIERFRVKCNGRGAAATSLSGGNLQKFIVGREISQNPRVLVVSQPTWGVDAGAAAAIQEALIALAEAGTAVLVISQDLDELMQITNRIAAICAGRLSAAIDTTDATVERIGLLMGGAALEDTHAEA